MSNTSQENAMTEIALAMAMGFFSVMVLTAISMGIPVSKVSTNTKLTIPVALLANSTPTKGKGTKLTKEDVLVVFDGIQYRDQKLNILDPASIDSGVRVVLAVKPELTMAATLKAQKGFKGSKIVVTTLNNGWQKVLKKTKNVK